MSKIRLIAGLGNPGKQYENTRHNAGVWYLRSLADKYNVSFRTESKFGGELTRIQTDRIDTFLLFPTGFMNLSGHAIQKVCQFYKISTDEVLVAHDELDLTCGTIKLKKGGGHGGHNGLRDTHTQLGSNNYYRLRIGIDHPGHKNAVTGYVLSPPTLNQKIDIDHAIERAVAETGNIIEGKIDNAMQTLHTQD